MPKKLHDKLARQADKNIKAGKMPAGKKGAYVYGTLDKAEKPRSRGKKGK